MEVLNVRYDNITVKCALKKIFSLLEEEKKRNLFFLNTDCLRQAQTDREYCEILNSADLVLPDGIGLRFVTWLFGGKMKDNCNGTDLSPLIMEELARKKYKIYLLGGKQSVAEKAAENIKKRIPHIQIRGTHTGYFKNDNEIINKINASGSDIIFVALGVPKQEKWISQHREKLNPRLCMGVGALIDYLSESIPRAPLWMRKLHIEWFWRIIIDPKRMFQRYIIDGFCFMVYALFIRIGINKCHIKKNAEAAKK